MSFCKDCISGVRIEGTPEGKFEKVGGVDAYISTPSVDYPKDAVIVFLTDIFGITLINSQLLADDFARNGFKVVMIDVFNGDPVPEDAMSGGVPDFNLPSWFKKHGNETIEPQVDASIRALEDQGITRFAFTGYSRLAFDLAFKGKAKAIAVSHPSLLKVPEDFEKYKLQVKAPLLINSCEEDVQFPINSQTIVDGIMTGFTPGYKRTYWEGCTHGFAVRGDMNNSKVKAGKEGAFQATVLWFLNHL